MSVSILVDMNLSPEWVPLLTHAGWPSVHWSQVGDSRAADMIILVRSSFSSSALCGS
jgi:predicted nuclease of predicted toxin-antitoxin system